MRRQLPPLLALRAFDAVGRHMSFSRAAEELCVTHGAVSRQIRALEIHLGQPLFVRQTRRVAFTPAGERYFNEIATLIAGIERATRAIALGRDRHLTVDAVPSTASVWMMPRLPAFTERSGIEVNVISSIAPVDFRTGAADVAIRVGQVPGRRYSPRRARVPHRMVENWNGIAAEHLWDEVLVPVCSRKFLQMHPEIAAPAKIDSRHLIHVTSRRSAWADWFALHSEPGGLPDDGIEVGHQYVALQTARRHRGIALVPTFHVDAVEWKDELVRPTPGELRSAGGFYLLYRSEDAARPKIAAFRDWLRTPQRGRASRPAPASRAHTKAAPSRRRKSTTAGESPGRPDARNKAPAQRE
jgi:LysR family transcriptional regulator, glycine cleavage system transcriptional activator